MTDFKNIFIKKTFHMTYWKIVSELLHVMKRKKTILKLFAAIWVMSTNKAVKMFYDVIIPYSYILHGK